MRILCLSLLGAAFSLSLAASVSGAQAAALAPNCYRITVVTQDVSGAGTDANITATFSNQDGISVPWVLNPQMAGNAFERGSVDVGVYCTDQALGAPTSLTLYSDGYGSGSAWDVDSVQIQPDGLTDPNQLLSVFPFGQTLDDEQTLTAQNVLPYSDDWDVVTVAFRTGTRSGSGTDANVWLTVKGDKGRTDKTRLNGYISGDAFENGSTDEVTFFVPQLIGKPGTITLELEGAYAANAWYLRDVVIKTRNPEPATFTIEKFLDSGGDATLQGTFTADLQRKKLDKVRDLGPDLATVLETQFQHNLGNSVSRKVTFEFKQGIESSVELMDANNSTNTQSLSVTAKAGNDQSAYTIEANAGIEFSQEIQSEITRALSYLSETTTTQEFDIPADYIMFVECTWAIPQQKFLVTDKQEEFVLRVASGVPQLNCGPNPIGPGDEMSVELQQLASQRLANWESVKARAIKAGITMAE